MKIIYFSPHLDDAIFSCGGIISHQIRNNQQVAIWSFFTADPPVDNITFFARVLHRRWGKMGSPYALRRQEDIEACQLLSVEWKHFGFEDCIYRRYPSNNAPLVRIKADLFRPVKESETQLEGKLYDVIQKNLSPQDQIVLPLEAGGHIDHVLIKNVGSLFPNKKYFYPDFPYAGNLRSVSELNLPKKAEVMIFSLEDSDISLWKKASATYRSQISSFWKSTEILEVEIEKFAASPLGAALWSIPVS